MGKPIRCEIHGRMVPKKNAKRVVPGRKFPISSKAWRDYEKSARFELMVQIKRKPLTEPVHVCARYYPPDRRLPDLSAMLETVGDLLEGYAYENDRQVCSWDGSRIMPVDKGNPRIVIEVSA